VNELTEILIIFYFINAKNTNSYDSFNVFSHGARVHSGHVEQEAWGHGPAAGAEDRSLPRKSAQFVITFETMESAFGGNLKKVRN
jgi:hypothetical protein